LGKFSADVRADTLALKEEAVNEGSKNKQLSKRDKKSEHLPTRCGRNVNGKSIVQSDELMKAYQFKTVPGYGHTLVWINDGTPDLSKEQRLERYPDSVVPGPGGTSLHFVTFPSKGKILPCTRRIPSTTPLSTRERCGWRS
jgi:hypothetical protein